MTGTTTEQPTRARPDREQPAPARPGWGAHPLLATVIQGVVVLVPAAGAALLAWAVASRFGRPGGVAAVGWWAGMLALGSAVYVLLERLATRLLPLAALLRLSLVVPDQTPSRYSIALRSGTTKHLRDVVDRAERGDIGDTPAEAAETVLLLTAALNRHDRLTRGHSERVRAYAEVLGAEMGLDEAALDRLRWASLLHDVGKLAVPGEILNKPGKLTAEEFEVVKTHPLEGERLVAPLADWLGDAANAVGEHHERWDGAGYPRGLAGNEISLAARIVAVADTFDVITSARSYKRPIPAAEARAEIARCAGTQFDPAVTKALLGVSLGRLWRAGGPLTWLLSAPALVNAPVIGGAVTSVGSTASAMGVAAVVALGGTTVAAATSGPAVPTLGEEVAAVGETADDPRSPEGSAGTGAGDAAPGHLLDGRVTAEGSDASPPGPPPLVADPTTPPPGVQEGRPGTGDAVSRLPELMPPSPTDEDEEDGDEETGDEEESDEEEGEGQDGRERREPAQNQPSAPEPPAQGPPTSSPATPGPPGNPTPGPPGNPTPGPPSGVGQGDPPRGGPRDR